MLCSIDSLKSSSSGSEKSTAGDLIAVNKYQNRQILYISVSLASDNAGKSRSHFKHFPSLQKACTNYFIIPHLYVLLHFPLTFFIQIYKPDPTQSFKDCNEIIKIEKIT